MRSDMADNVIGPGWSRCHDDYRRRIDAQEPNEFIRGPKWRTRTTPGRRWAVAALTFALIVVLGLAVATLASVGLRALDAPAWVVALPWILPILGTVVWTLRGPRPALLSDDDDESWSGYAIRSVMVGADEPRSVGSRALMGLVFGAPIVWSFIILTALELTGLF